MAELPKKLTIFLAADGTTGDALRVGVETHGGVLQTVGATCSAVFDTAGSGLRAALEVVRTANRDGADAVLPRIALYSSRAAQEDIAGWAVPPRAMMLMEAAHGGQVLVSARTRELFGDDLPSGVTLRDLGEHRLRDLQHPERIYQVIALDLPDAFPALNTLDRFRNNLPIQGTGLIGRASEAAAIREQVAGGVRLVTLTGPGGTGKTRLALEAAATLLDMYEDGVFFVGLAPVDEPGLVGATIAQTLGVREAGGQPLAASLQAYLRDKNILLLLDNFEQVTDAAPLIADLLPHAPGLAVLVTSRERLGLSEEHVFDVPPLAVPDPEAPPARKGVVAALEQFEAVRLFVERAKMVHPEFVLTDANARAVAEICVRLDGLPLAIELAAARVGLLPPQALVSRLTRGLHLLSGSAFNLPPRQQTLRGTIAWSYDLLSTEEQQLFRRLGVFAGGFTPAAVTAVCGDPGDGLLSLAAKSLLRREQHGELRFFMLDTIRQFALERLRQSGEADAIRQHYAAYFLALAEQAEPELTGPQQQHWLDQLALEHNNLRAVLTTLLEQNE
ncbi:MAG TPA: NB-ARC domain-containing protein, partial [Herpetosiphonaceae bacterium]|nr:NB-ARC domain-containing protein [Herpetosiphonaceae bacterium]